MPLIQSTLKTNLLNLFNAMKKTEMSEADFTEQIATIINNHVKTATVTVSAGIPVATSGSAVAQSGATTAPGAGSLS